jgi:hypothetical protein
MGHIIEPAASGRAKCRGCKQAISKGELRFGEQLPNPFADGDMTIWFHLPCAAFRRPESLNEVLDENMDVLESDKSIQVPMLRNAIDAGLNYHRLERIAGVQRSPSGRARCRSCREPIPKDAFRITLEFFEEGMFNPAGYIHASCAGTYFETTDLIDRLSQFATELVQDDLDEIERELSDT